MWSELTLVHGTCFNAHSLGNKLGELNALPAGYANKTFDIIAVTETWLGSEVSDTLLCANASYIVIRKDSWADWEAMFVS